MPEQNTEDGIEHFEVRAMVDTDVDNVLQIERASYQIPWTEQIFRDCLKVGYFSLVIERNNHLYGYVIFSAAAGESHILNLCVSASHRRSGFAEALLSQAIASVIVAGAKVMFLEVRVSNHSAIALYEKLGFIETGRRENYYNAVPKNAKQSNREDALLMAKELAL